MHRLPYLVLVIQPNIFWKQIQVLEAIWALMRWYLLAPWQFCCQCTISNIFFNNYLVFINNSLFLFISYIISLYIDFINWPWAREKEDHHELPCLEAVLATLCKTISTWISPGLGNMITSGAESPCNGSL